MEKIQKIELSNVDRRILNRFVRWMKFFSIMYLTLWILMCISLFSLMWVIWKG